MRTYVPDFFGEHVKHKFYEGLCAGFFWGARKAHILWGLMCRTFWEIM